MTKSAILFVGQTVPGSRTFQRIKAFQKMGHEVDVISTNLPGSRYEDKPSLLTRLRYRLRYPADKAEAGEKIIEHLKARKYDILWLERAVEIGPQILTEVKNTSPDTCITWYAEDDMINPYHRTRQVEGAMPLYDLWVTTKSFNALPEEVPRFGVKNILVVNNSYDADLHRPTDLGEQDLSDFGADISFVGTYERERANSLIYLAEHGLSVRIWGNGWGGLIGRSPELVIEDRPAYDEEYIKVICASKINLCFLRKENRDLQTCRSIEIPACGGFMLHERNDEMTGIFEEDVEVAYFDNDQELFEQCKKWMLLDEERQAIAARGYNCVNQGSFSHTQRLQEILDAVQRIRAV
jgi:hypothetical protein